MNKLCIVFFVFVFTSCSSTTKFVFDESVPLEKSAIIVRNDRNTCTVLSVNGTPVEWEKIGNIEMQIPSGETELIISLHVSEYNVNHRVVYTYPRTKLIYNFAAGNKYFLWFYPDYSYLSGKFAEDGNLLTLP